MTSVVKHILEDEWPSVATGWYRSFVTAPLADFSLWDSDANGRPLLQAAFVTPLKKFSFSFRIQERGLRNFVYRLQATSFRTGFI